MDEVLRRVRAGLREVLFEQFANAVVVINQEQMRRPVERVEGGLVHRDFKPDNVLVGNDGRVRVMDFGLAKRLHGEGTIDESSAATPDGMVVGTREYMSPEQLRGKPLEPSSDLFAFGIILFEQIGRAHV